MIKVFSKIHEIQFRTLINNEPRKLNYRITCIIKLLIVNLVQNLTFSKINLVQHFLSMSARFPLVISADAFSLCRAWIPFSHHFEHSVHSVHSVGSLSSLFLVILFRDSWTSPQYVSLLVRFKVDHSRASTGPDGPEIPNSVVKKHQNALNETKRHLDGACDVWSS